MGNVYIKEIKAEQWAVIMGHKSWIQQTYLKKSSVLWRPLGLDEFNEREEMSKSSSGELLFSCGFKKQDTFS